MCGEEFGGGGGEVGEVGDCLDEGRGWVGGGGEEFNYVTWNET